MPSEASLSIEQRPAFQQLNPIHCEWRHDVSIIKAARRGRRMNRVLSCDCKQWDENFAWIIAGQFKKLFKGYRNFNSRIMRMLFVHCSIALVAFWLSRTRRESFILDTQESVCKVPWNIFPPSVYGIFNRCNKLSWLLVNINSGTLQRRYCQDFIDSVLKNLLMVFSSHRGTCYEINESFPEALERLKSWIMIRISSPRHWRFEVYVSAAF